MKKIVLMFIVLSVSVFACSNVYALDMDYYTYNGFDAILTAWQQTAMVFANGEYAALFFSIIVAAIMFGGAATYYKIFGGASVHPLAWAAPILFGVVIYLGAFVPTGTLHIYDPVLNKYQAVSGIPDGVILLAGTTNLVERGIVEIIETSGAPLSYKQYAGGIGFDALLKATDSPFLNNTYISASVDKYISDCLYFELNRPGTSLTVQDINNNNGTLLALFGLAANPAIFTVWYDASSQGGTSMSCYDDYTTLSTYLGDLTNMSSLINSKCASAGFDPNDSLQLAQCEQAIATTVQFTTGSANSVSTEKFFQQAVIAQRLATVITKGGVDQAVMMKGNTNTMSTMYGTGIMANEWIPIIRAVVTAVAIGLLPVLVIFIPTGVGNKAIGMITGFFIWLSIWGVTDVIIHQIATSYAYKYFEQARQNNIGFASIMAMPDASAKALGLFGVIRSLGMTLATAITIKIASFVDAHSLAMVGGQLSGSIQSQGGQAGEMTKVEGEAPSITGPVAAEATMANVHKYGMGGMAEAAATDQMTHTGSTLGSVRAIGGGNMSTTVDRMAASNVTQRAGDVGRSEGIGGPRHSEVKGRQDGAQSWGGAEQDARMAQSLGVSQEELGEFRQHGVITDKMASAIGRSLGLNPAQSRGLVGATAGPHGNGLSVSQDGGLMLTHAEKQSADGKTTWDHGMITNERTMTGGQLLDKAGELQKKGHVEAAEGMKRLVGRNATSSDGRIRGSAEHGRGLRPDESATFMEKESFAGQTAEVGVRHGSDLSWFETSSDKRGRTVDHGDHIRVGNTVDKGDHTTLGNTVTLNDGTSIPSQSAAQMALDGKPLLVSRTTNPKLSQNERNTQNLAVAAAVSDGMGSLIRRSGTSQDYSGMDGSIGGHIPGTEIGGSASTGARTSDQYDSSLMAQHYNEVLKLADREATAQRLSRPDTNVLKAKHLQSAVQEEKRYFEEHGKWSYGASAAAGRAASAMKPEPPDASKGGVDGIKG